MKNRNYLSENEKTLYLIVPFISIAFNAFISFILFDKINLFFIVLPIIFNIIIHKVSLKKFLIKIGYNYKISSLEKFFYYFAVISSLGLLYIITKGMQLGYKKALYEKKHQDLTDSEKFIYYISVIFLSLEPFISKILLKKALKELENNEYINLSPLETFFYYTRIFPLPNFYLKIVYKTTLIEDRIENNQFV